MNKDIYFKAFEYENLDFINTLQNEDVLFKLTCGNKYFTSSQYSKKWIEDKIFNTYNQLYLMIYTIDGNNPIGYVGITDIDYVNRKANFNAIVIDKKFWNRKYGFQAIILMLSHLFYELNMNMVYTYILETQLASLKIANKLGFKNIGVIKDFVYKQNKFCDVHMLNILKKDFENMDDKF